MTDAIIFAVAGLIFTYLSLKNNPDRGKILPFLVLGIILGGGVVLLLTF